MKTLSFLFYILLQGILLAPATGIVYYVKPTSPNSTNCTGLLCHTLQYYFENVDTTINNQKNVTMILMPGTHAPSIEFTVDITAPIINMTGESQEVVLNGSGTIYNGYTKLICFERFTEVSLSNIVIINWYFTIQNANTPLASRFTMSSVILHGNGNNLQLFTDASFRFDSCEFYDIEWYISTYGMTMTMENCTLTRNVLLHNVSTTGISELMDTNRSLAMNTNVSISMNMSFVKMYSSMLDIQAMFVHTRFDSCEFRDNNSTMIAGATSVTMENCKLINNPLIIVNSNIVISGVSLFTATERSSSVSSYFSNITLSGVVIFSNNSGIKGGAMALYSSMLNVAPGTNVSFIDNSAVETGGAIFIYPSLIPTRLWLTLLKQQSFIIPEQDIRPQCFYRLLNCSAGASYTFSFVNNSAMYGGDDIYGASLNYHQSSGNCNLTVIKNNTGLSPVSSDPTRVCVCDNKGIPQCKNDTYNIIRDVEVYPGELFTVSAVVVGGDFGVTRGSVHADFSHLHPPLPSLTSPSQYTQMIYDVTHCSNLSYSLYEHNTSIMMLLTTEYIGTEVYYIMPCDYDEESCFRTIPVYLVITLLPCPPGFTLIEKLPICDCYPALTAHKVRCEIINKRGLFSWNSDLWVNITEDGIAYGRFCPFNYCKTKNQQIDLKNDSDSQCAFNRAGRLCGGCKEGYSLAIGSSHCIHCPNNNNLALLIFFAAAGLLLVFFISAFNLTVTQGMINGLIFYANVLWAHQGLLFPQQTGANGVALTLMATGRTFIAWLNLDFGIQICFFNGLTAFWKTWLQYLFPFYTAGLFFIGLRYFSKLAKLFGSRSVPTLATLLFLSYTKLF